LGAGKVGDWGWEDLTGPAIGVAACMGDFCPPRLAGNPLMATPDTGNLPACMAGPLDAAWRMLLNPPAVSAQALTLRLIRATAERVRNMQRINVLLLGELVGTNNRNA
jgi:hypothetical protein